MKLKSDRDKKASETKQKSAEEAMAAWITHFENENDKLKQLSEADKMKLVQLETKIQELVKSSGKDKKQI